MERDIGKNKVASRGRGTRRRGEQNNPPEEMEGNQNNLFLLPLHSLSLFLSHYPRLSSTAAIQQLLLSQIHQRGKKKERKATAHAIKHKAVRKEAKRRGEEEAAKEGDGGGRPVIKFVG